MREIVAQLLIPMCEKELGAIRETLAKAIGETGSVLREEINRKPETVQEAVKKIGDDPALEAARKAMLDGRFPEALRQIEELATREPKYRANVLTLLASSPHPTHRAQALQMLDAVGEPRHYLALAFTHWQDGDLRTAISLAERGLEKAQQAKDTEHLHALKNSLAYYYADAEVVEKADLARRYSEDALRERRERGMSPELIANALATVGYGKITFGKNREEIRQGMYDNEEALKMGAREDLYFKHLSRAQKRLSVL